MITLSEFFGIYLPMLGFVITLMTLLWPLSILLRNASIVDPFWGMGFIFTALWCIFKFGPPQSFDDWLMLVLLIIWGLRLSGYLLFRNWGKGEDPRYQAFRAHYGANRYWYISLFQVFWLQGFILWLVFLPFTVIWLQTSGVKVWLMVLGVMLWLAGFGFEAIADAQLFHFKKKSENRGKIFDRGLWAWTRHPNYFGESLLWWGFGLMAAAQGFWLALVSPMLMTWLLLRVSGVRMTERKMLAERSEYAEYVRRVPAFLPRRPKN